MRSGASADTAALEFSGFMLSREIAEGLIDSDRGTTMAGAEE